MQKKFVIEDFASQPSFETFPNPTPGEIRVSSEKNKISMVEVLSLKGESVYLIDDFESCFSIQFNIMHMVPGVNVLKVVFENQKKVYSKIILLPIQ